jgi:hypothetical protein
MIPKKSLIVFVALATLQLPAFADGIPTAPPGTGPNPFSDCGIGAALFPNSRFGAVLSNITWFSGTTAVTSAISSPETCNDNTKTALRFINDTYEQLTEETAHGNGEHLTALLNIYGCSVPQRAGVVAATRSGMADAVAQPGYATQDRTEKATQFFWAIDGAAATGCAS